mgnify:CR=1 FL=1
MTIPVMICCLLLPAGCEEDTMAPRQQLSDDWFRQFDQIRQSGPAENTARTQSRSQRQGPKIEFEQEVYDFGNVGPGTNNLCEFRFTNVGNAALKIGEITKTCGCTPFSLEKREYAPGESGTLKVKYFSEELRGQTTKSLVMHSNDPARPEIKLAIKANIMIQVDHDPKTLNLLLKKENADCPELTLTSVDERPFSITSFKSTGNCITADFDPSQKATKFVLQPRVDMEMLEKTMNGRIEIGLDHPECEKISVAIHTLPRFKIAPRSLIVRSMASREPIEKKLRILNNYNEDFDLDTFWSNKGTIKVLSNTEIPNGYELELEITPPASKNTKRIFTETFVVRTKEGLQLEIPCNVFYSRKIPASLTTKTKEEECPTCGPKIMNFSNGTATLFTAEE